LSTLLLLLLLLLLETANQSKHYNAVRSFSGEKKLGHFFSSAKPFSGWLAG
jgi:hypothetical protein